MTLGGRVLVQEGHNPLGLGVLGLKPVAGHNGPEDVDDRDAENCLHPEVAALVLGQQDDEILHLKGQFFKLK